MCHFIYFSTDCEKDLSLLSSELFGVLSVDDPVFPDLDGVVQYPHKWYLQCRYGGCSCHFRHSSQGDFLDVGEDPDDDDDIESTQAAFDLFKQLVSDGCRVDVFDSWDDEFPAVIRSLDVDVGMVSRDEFRFLENVRMEFCLA